MTKTQTTTLEIIKAAGETGYPMWKRAKGYNLNAVYALKDRGIIRFESVNNIDTIFVV